MKGGKCGSKRIEEEYKSNFSGIPIELNVLCKSFFLWRVPLTGCVFSHFLTEIGLDLNSLIE